MTTKHLEILDICCLAAMCVAIIFMWIHFFTGNLSVQESLIAPCFFLGAWCASKRVRRQINRNKLEEFKKR